jgi:hypothetical protein
MKKAIQLNFVWNEKSYSFKIQKKKEKKKGMLYLKALKKGGA